MELGNLLLKKENVPIRYDTCFYMPVPRRLLNQDIQLDPELANKVFPQAAEEWYDDLGEYTKKLEEGEKKDWFERVFLKERPKIELRYSAQQIQSTLWEDYVLTTKTGFAEVLSISRNHGGTLYLGADDIEGNILPTLGVRDVRTNLSDEQIKEFGTPTGLEKGNYRLKTYLHHNVDHYPGALFLRNWAILYMNESLKQIY